jgi:general secretion pathway protein E
MGIEPYLLRSGLLAVVAQRLVRTLCSCARPDTTLDAASRLGLPVSSARLPVGCDRCAGTGYLGRLVVAEYLPTDSDAIGSAILDRVEVARLERAAIAAGMITRWQRALHLVESGKTSAAEVRRVLGVGGPTDRPE